MVRAFTAHPSLTTEALRFHSLSSTEELSRLFDFNQKPVSSDKNTSLNAVIGKAVTVEIERKDPHSRYLSGKDPLARAGGLASRSMK